MLDARGLAASVSSVLHGDAAGDMLGSSTGGDDLLMGNSADDQLYGDASGSLSGAPPRGSHPYPRSPDAATPAHRERQSWGERPGRRQRRRRFRPWATPLSWRAPPWAAARRRAGEHGRRRGLWRCRQLAGICPGRRRPRARRGRRRPAMGRRQSLRRRRGRQRRVHLRRRDGRRHHLRFRARQRPDRLQDLIAIDVTISISGGNSVLSTSGGDSVTVVDYTGPFMIGTDIIFLA